MTYDVGVVPWIPGRVIPDPACHLGDHYVAIKSERQRTTEDSYEKN
jgi:hypothetical protein